MSDCPADKKEFTSRTIISKIDQCKKDKKTFYSFEFFPPKTDIGVQNLYSRLDRLSNLEPMFMDVTWGAGGTTADLTMEISSNAQNFTGCEVMMHLTCTNMSIEMIDKALKDAKAAGIRNILALRGDPPKGADQWEKCENGFGYAVDLVKYIREHYGDYFGIAVAGYPEMHVEAESKEKDLQYLKEKIDAGADFVITQLFYSVDLFLQWVDDCRKIGITCPIIPGIMPIQNYRGFKRMTGFCKTFVPQEILDALEPIKDDDAAVKAFGIDFGASMCRKLIAAGVPGLHFYTLNLERSVTKTLEKLGLIASKKTGVLPWMQSQVARRQTETVRPIFWSNRPKSYLERTVHWDEFPNGRWGDSSSPAFGDLSDHHLLNFRTGKIEERRKIWGENPTKPVDIFGIFTKFLEGKINRLPWCETSPSAETAVVLDSLLRLNSAGFLTINSQPRVNAASSSDPALGWGGPGGYVYQKAYLEFFTSVANVDRFVKLAEDYPTLSYTAVNREGKIITNIRSSRTTVNAVTWGVFPDREIVQPTIVDSESFLAWKGECFGLWQQWMDIYDENSDSRDLLQGIQNEYYLVNVVDNDYVNGDIFAVFEKLLR